MSVKMGLLPLVDQLISVNLANFDQVYVCVSVCYRMPRQQAVDLSMSFMSMVLIIFEY